LSATAQAKTAGLLQRVADANMQASRRFAQRWRLESDKPLWQRFARMAGEAVSALPSGATVLDLGGGRRCVYGAAVTQADRLRLIAVDISAEELALNHDVSETCVANVAEELPFPDGSVDLILSRALLEHVDGVPGAAQNMARVLRPGARALHLVPCRYSLFGLAARLLPFQPLLRLLHLVKPDSVGQVEFKVHYDHCYPSAMRSAFLEAGFSDVEIVTCWAQPGYFEPVFPAFVLTSLYEFLVRKLKISDLASYMIVSATR
jgi:SAM-dependent methyltransferase